MHNTIISIVIPVYNAESYIAEAIQSVLTQTYRPIELIIVDDGSTDSTPAILQRFQGAIHLVRQNNVGQSAALNRGWSIADGELLGYLSADDALRPQAIERLAAALANNSSAVLAYPDFGLIDENSRPTGIVRTADYSEQTLYRDLVCLPGPGALFRRETFQQTGGWDPTFKQIPDLEFFFRLALQGPFLRVPEVLAEFRKHPDSATYRAVSKCRADEPIRLTNKFFDRTDIPLNVRGWRRQIAANAFLLSGMIHGQSGRLWTALGCFAQACVNSPQTVLSMKAAGYALRIARINLNNIAGRS